MQLATRYGKLPDEVIYAAESGWDHTARFAFNDGVTAYVEGFERMRDKTREVSAPRPVSNRRSYKKTVPVHTEADLLAHLGIDPEDTQAREALKKAVTPEAWAQFIEGEWDTEPDTVDHR